MLVLKVEYSRIEKDLNVNVKKRVTKLFVGGEVVIYSEYPVNSLGDGYHEVADNHTSFICGPKCDVNIPCNIATMDIFDIGNKLLYSILILPGCKCSFLIDGIVINVFETSV